MAKIHWNQDAIEDILRRDSVADQVNNLAEAIADKVRDQGIEVVGIPGDIDLPVTVATYSTDRARASVILAHPSGLVVQAKHGALSRAAADLGLEVNE